MKAPEKIYIDSDENWHRTHTAFTEKAKGNDVEYVRKDAFIEKACEFWKDHLAGYDICDDDIERSVESFKLAMKYFLLKVQIVFTKKK